MTDIVARDDQSQTLAGGRAAPRQQQAARRAQGRNPELGGSVDDSLKWWMFLDARVPYSKEEDASGSPFSITRRRATRGIRARCG